MGDPFEERYQDVLQNVEFAIVAVYREHPELADANVDRALEGLIRSYTATMKGRPAPALAPSALDQALLSRVYGICEWRLGHTDGLPASEGAWPFRPEPKTADEIVACLKRIRKSVRFWTREGGRQGYLRFASQFIP